MRVAVARGRFEDVSGWFVTTSWLFYALTTAALFVQRRREARGEIATPSYRTPFFPLPALLFIVATAMIIASDLHDSGWTRVGRRRHRRARVPGLLAVEGPPHRRLGA